MAGSSVDKETEPEALAIVADLVAASGNAVKAETLAHRTLSFEDPVFCSHLEAALGEEPSVVPYLASSYLPLKRYILDFDAITPKISGGTSTTVEIREP
jgi:hypothetical protein